MCQGEGNVDDLEGEIDEVRVWSKARTAEQIRDNLFRKLTESEPDLVGLWNFDDPGAPGPDSSPGEHHGKLFGQAALARAPLPEALLYGRVTDPAGNPGQVRGMDLVVEGQGSAAYTLNWTVTAAIDYAGNTITYSGSVSGVGNTDVPFSIPLS